MPKKTLILIALAISPAAALAAPSPTAVSIAADPMIVTYGSPLALSGAVTPAGSVKVSVSSQACVKGQAQQSPLNVTSTAQGAWSATVTPGSRTMYQAKAKSTNSPTVTVQVRPQVALAKVGSHRFRTRVSVAQSFGAKIALFQKQTSAGWKTVKSVVLVELASGNGTIVSGKTFRSGIRAHKTVRILLTQRQVGECYLAGTSNSISS
ncbi:MAG: hypothetical protein H0W87_09770 [Actinobacteria bacterium]|nr:hypothetical protein [Actinomycetota bacterium]